MYANFLLHVDHHIQISDLELCKAAAVNEITFSSYSFIEKLIQILDLYIHI